MENLGAEATFNTSTKCRRAARVQTLWDDLPRIANSSPERTGYPTQKPVALAERIIKASCPEGGVVLDCFAGCAYAAVAAERLERNWIACDINPRAWTVFKRQFSKPKLTMLTCDEPTHNLQKVLLGNMATVRGLTSCRHAPLNSGIDAAGVQTYGQATSVQDTGQHHP